MPRKLVLANWKMHGDLKRNEALLLALREGAAGLEADVGVFPPFPYLGQAQCLLQGSPVFWGGQNVSAFEAGAYTGEVSAAMLKEFGGTHVLIGHSERRTLYGEQPSVVAEKLRRALLAGLRPVLCIGETLAERDAGEARPVIRQQLLEAVGPLGVEAFAPVVVAYEPVWAIGTGRAATLDQVAEMHGFIHDTLADLGLAPGINPVLYGGSVKAQGADALFALNGVDGALVGGASLVAEEFLAICAAASRAAQA